MFYVQMYGNQDDDSNFSLLLLLTQRENVSVIFYFYKQTNKQKRTLKNMKNALTIRFCNKTPFFYKTFKENNL